MSARSAADPLPGLVLLPFTDALAPHFAAINTAWIEEMFAMEPADRDVLDHPRARLIDTGGAILFVAAPDLGIIGAAALRKTGDAQFELTKMGVTTAARGRQAGAFLLAAIIARAYALGAETVYLLTNRACAAAIHLYEKQGFVHDQQIMEAFGARYARCDVAMRHRPDLRPD
ncbi:MAG: GNAT family N-acetyltransferase [Sphingomonas sp.]